MCITFHNMLPPSNGVILPNFDDFSPLIERFKPSVVYQQQRPSSSQNLLTLIRCLLLWLLNDLLTSASIFLHQHKYTQELIALARLQDGRSVDTPLEVNVKYHCDEGDFLSNSSLHRQLVGSVNYLTITRLDISFVVQQVSQFMQAPNFHLAVVCRIVRYLQGTSSCDIFFPVGSLIHLVAYNDAVWAGCFDTRRSINGWCMFLGNSLISWKSNKQDRVSKSSTESEYRAMSSVCFEIVWIWGLLAEL
ncbi:uncharacterized protein LOC111380015, partial [Olea europaea var. sylvestris]|uniref:uncharacterized protein LOC111380015 n=1 Tax=Olea europaea var. sylvestris TaxID=158386 RepID=UPI000C1D44EE